jgi:hypothetical protein
MGRIKRSRRRSVRILSLAVFLFVRVGSPQRTVAGAPQGEEVLSRRLPALRFDGVTVARAFWEVTNDARVPGGIVSIEGHPEELGANLAMPAGLTLREALDQIVSESPALAWRQDGGVVDLLPPRALPELLNVEIASYDFDDANNGSLAVQELLDEPQVLRRYRMLRLQPEPSSVGLTVYYGPGEKRPARLPVHLRNVTLLEALNALVRARGTDHWLYQEASLESKKTFRITLGAGPP